MADAPLMLTVSGLRGTFGGSLTPEVLVRYAGVFVDFLRERNGRGSPAYRPTVVLAYDGRRGSFPIEQLIYSAIELHGGTVQWITPTVCATPTVGLAVDKLGADGGLQITASHNPQQWCGLKPILRDHTAKRGIVNASAPPQAVAAQLVERFRAGAVHPAAWEQINSTKTKRLDVLAAHTKTVAKALGRATVSAVRKRRFKVAVDCVTISGHQAAGAMLKTLGATPTFINDEKPLWAGLFPHTPEPTRENLVGLARAMKKAKGKLTVGFALDPDGDRLAVVDEQGTYIGEEYTLVLAAMAMGELGQLKKGQVLAVNLSTSRMIEDVAAKYGCTVVRAAVGEANVVQAMRANKSPFGGEGNGGVIWPKVTYIRDSLGSMALILALMAKRKQTISQLVARIPAYCIIKRKVDLASSHINPKTIIDRLATRHAAHAPDRTDGVWINFQAQRAWLHVRASNTEPILRLIAEAPTQAQAQAILDDAAAAIA